MQNGNLLKKVVGLNTIQKILVFAFLVYLLVVGFFLGIRYQQNKDSEAFNTIMREAIKLSESQQLVYVNTCDSPEPAPLEGKLETHISKNLDISFKYFQNEKDKKPMKVKEIGNKVYLYINYSDTEPDNPTSGNHLEVFTKDPNISLEKVINQKFLKDYSPENCEVIYKSMSPPYGISQSHIKYTPEFEYVYIKVANINPDDTYSERQEKASHCPVEYAYYNGIRYFVMDKNHPDKFAFVNIGQSSFGSYPGLSWDLTLQFND